MKQKQNIPGLFGTALCVVFGFLPLGLFVLGKSDPALTVCLLLNAFAWGVLGTLQIQREKRKTELDELSQILGSDMGSDPLATIYYELKRKELAFDARILEGPVSKSNDLSRYLYQVVERAYKLLSADAVELSLLDEQVGVFHASVTIGNLALLEKYPEGSGLHAASQNIMFAGDQMGKLRILYKKERHLSQADREILRLLSVQACIAILNSKYTKEVLRMRGEAEENVKAKTGFLANLSHELRGPIGIVLNAADLLLEGLCGPLELEQKETLRMISLNGRHLFDMINDVLDYAKAESGKVAPKAENIDANSLVLEVSQMVRSEAESKGHTIQCGGAAPDAWIHADKRHVRQILINLLTNAIKYTRDGGKIEIWGERQSAGKIRLFVRDTGVGIDESDREKVFQAFERLKDDYSQAQRGTGLGLSLTKKLAELNGGTIDFTSEKGNGTTFWVVLPPGSQPKIQPESNSANPHGQVLGKGELLLILEPNIDERRMLVKYLEHSGFEVQVVESWNIMKEVTKRASVFLVIASDQSFDSGLLQDFKAGTASRVPVLILANDAFTVDTERYLRAGVDRCLTKPVRLDDLAVTVREILDTHTVISSPESVL